MGPVVLSEYTLDSPSKFLKIPISEIYSRQVISGPVRGHLTGECHISDTEASHPNADEDISSRPSPLQVRSGA